MDCFRCGSDEHLSRDCDVRAPRRRRAPAAALASPAAQEEVKTPPPLPPRATGCQATRLRLIAVGQAAALRARMGWSEDQKAQRLREMAREQVIESRVSRIAAV
jgi:Zinc knuckle